MKKIIFTAFFIVIILIVYLELNKNSFEKAMNLYNTGNLSAAIVELENIKSGDIKYDEAKLLIKKIKQNINEKTELRINQKLKIDSLKKIEDSLKVRRNSLATIKNTIFMIDNFQIDHYENNLKGIACIIKVFTDYENKIIHSKKSEIDSVKQYAKIAEKKIRNKRYQNWPILRRNFADYIAKEVWIYDAYVYTTSHRNTVIEFVSLEYALNKNIKKTHDDLYDIFLKLRFKKVIYKASNHDEDYKYYPLNTKQDPDFEII